MTFGVHPFILIAAVGVIVALVAVVVACVVRSRGMRALMIVLALVFLLPAAYLFLASTQLLRFTIAGAVSP